MIALTPHQILAAARYLVCQRAPYFRAGVMNLVPRESPGLGTFATTNTWIMLWDPASAIEWGIEGCAFVIAHELQHLILGHFERFSAPLINQDIANLAGDLAINPSLRDMSFLVPQKKDNEDDTGAWSALYGFDENLTAEQYYAELLKQRVQCSYTDAGGGGENGKQGNLVLDGCGSCSGRKRADEPEEGDVDARSETDQQHVRVVVAQAIKEHMRRGKVPGHLSRWANAALAPPKVRWQDRLARAARGAICARVGSSYGTYTRPSRRQGGLGFGPGCPIMPSYRASTPRVTLLIDTSGSMGDKALAEVMNEAQGIFAAAGSLVDVVVCDAAVHAAKRVRSVAEACAMLTGGGGSDFCPAFDEIARRRPKTDIIVAATDGDITVPTIAPIGVQVIWLLVKGEYNSTYRQPCSWGTSIEVK